MKKGGLRNFIIFTGKRLCQGLRPATWWNKRLWTGDLLWSLQNSNNTFFTENLWMTASEFATETLIFRSIRSQIIFKISVLKNFAILEPLSNNKVTDLLLQNTYGGCFWIFVAANIFLQVNMVFIADSPTSFCSGLLLKLDFKEFNFIKKEVPGKMIFCEFREISHKTFLKKLLGRLLLHKHSF